MDNAILKFKEAAVAFQQEENYKKLAAARKANDEDSELQKQLGDFNLVRLDLNNELHKEERDDKRVAELNERINNLYNDIMSNKNMVAYNQAKEEIEGFIQYVNAILNAAIDGEDPLQVGPPPVEEEGCGGSCSSCAGC
ncbi:YlbF family regulator [Ruminococcaceae bacterium OttesenSCG-928-I18]|nr:YlbF family regulator [Ruminococcaceae bacterium OttesenSCG-928-I18]